MVNAEYYKTARGEKRENPDKNMECNGCVLKRISTISMDYMDLYALDLFRYQELDFHRATLVLRYKGLSCFSGISVILPPFRLFFRLHAFYDFDGF